jgi:hypothetical protein
MSSEIRLQMTEEQEGDIYEILRTVGLRGLIKYLARLTMDTSEEKKGHIFTYDEALLWRYASEELIELYRKLQIEHEALPKREIPVKEKIG